MSATERAPCIGDLVELYTGIYGIVLISNPPASTDLIDRELGPMTPHTYDILWMDPTGIPFRGTIRYGFSSWKSGLISLITSV